MDSAIALHWAIAEYGRERAFTLSVECGKRHRRELASAERIATRASVAHVERAMSIPWGESLLTSGISTSPIVPGRNVILATLAAAEVVRGRGVVGGCGTRRVRISGTTITQNACALRAWRALRGEPDSSELVFTDENGAPLRLSHLAQTLREHLMKAGVTRAELFARSATRRPIRVHDLRATFVTVSLATGRTETSVADRTGHTSSVMINRYRPVARGNGHRDAPTTRLRRPGAYARAPGLRR